MQKLHEEIVSVVRDYQKLEARLVGLLQQADSSKLYLKHWQTSLFRYCVHVLGLTEDRAYVLITVCRKAREVPELKKAIDEGLSVSKAVKISSVLNPQSSENSQWIQKAIELSKASLEKEVAKANPKASTQERVRYVQESRLDLKMGISESVHSKLRRAQDIVSQKNGSHATLELALEAALDAFLEKHDPVKVAKRREEKRKTKEIKLNSSRDEFEKRTAIPAANKDHVQLRAQNRCEWVHLNDNLDRCSNTRWLDFHHLEPVSEGGTNDINNLMLVCRAHHREFHRLMNGAKRDFEKVSRYSMTLEELEETDSWVPIDPGIG